ncbi:945cf1f9-ffcb-4a83-a79b-59fb46b138a5 [Sclerotinia trifoliorum]|uniref:945cf1f9-ffcb-4a83-a79b-59fb46b138a5 n=1 Tax=Sclerotinia trifoliorum TaxID=28548 RepID=A0A8H2VVP7_9HELO|nr:945cf1f9-ffcb-4a83-a79b-59fb46b138a5 [Sclerotinia trifoliorum]
MSSPSVLSNKDVNISAMNQHTVVVVDEKKITMVADPHNMEYHRQVLQNKMQQNAGQEEKYISPSDTIQSPTTAKLSAYRNKQVGKNTKPRSLFAKTSAKKFSAANNGQLFGKDISSPKETTDENIAGDAMQE